MTGYLFGILAVLVLGFSYNNHPSTTELDKLPLIMALILSIFSWVGFIMFVMYLMINVTQEVLQNTTVKKTWDKTKNFYEGK